MAAIILSDMSASVSELKRNPNGDCQCWKGFSSCYIE